MNGLLGTNFTVAVLNNVLMSVDAGRCGRQKRKATGTITTSARIRAK